MAAAGLTEAINALVEADLLEGKESKRLVDVCRARQLLEESLEMAGDFMMMTRAETSPAEVMQKPFVKGPRSESRTSNLLQRPGSASSIGTLGAQRGRRGSMPRLLAPEVPRSASPSPAPLVQRGRSASLSSIRPMSSSRASASPVPQGLSSLEDFVRHFCPVSQGMEAKIFRGICRDAGLFDTRFGAADADLIFGAIAPRSTRKLDPTQFEAAMRHVGERKGLTQEALWEQLYGLVESPQASRDQLRGDGEQKDNGQTKKIALIEALPRPRSSALPRDPLSRNRPSSATGGPFSRVPDRRRTVPSQFRLDPNTSQVELEMFLDTFQSFCWGRPDMDARSFVRLCRDTQLLDDKFTALDADFLFTKVTQKSQRRLDFPGFEALLETIAEKRGVPFSSMRRAIAFSSGPMVAATKVQSVRLHDERAF